MRAMSTNVGTMGTLHCDDIDERTSRNSPACGGDFLSFRHFAEPTLGSRCLDSHWRSDLVEAARGPARSAGGGPRGDSMVCAVYAPKCLNGNVGGASTLAVCMYE